MVNLLLSTSSPLGMLVTFVIGFFILVLPGILVEKKKQERLRQESIMRNFDNVNGDSSQSQFDNIEKVINTQSLEISEDDDDGGEPEEKEINNMNPIQLLGQGKRFIGSDYKTELSSLVRNGICVILQPIANSEGDNAIIYIGTHRTNGRLHKRLNQHFNGDRDGSAFRRSLGIKAGLWQENELDAYISQQKISFIVIEVDDDAQRQELCEHLIAEIAQMPMYRNCLLNENHVGGRTLTPSDIELIQHGLVRK